MDSEARLVHIFCDASKDAIGAVAYLQHFGPNGTKTTLSFLLRKGKLAPNGSNTIPRMELCAAVLGAEIIKEQLNIPSECFRYYTASQIVLGYLTNTTRRFYVYVSNRVNRIHQSSFPNQWTHVPTEQNPADLATRSLHVSQLTNSLWLRGPQLVTLTNSFLEPPFSFQLVDPQDDDEIRPEVSCSKVEVDEVKPVVHKIGSERFSRFSSWKSLVRGIKALKQFIFKHLNTALQSCEAYRQAELFIIQTSRREAYGDAIRSIQNGQPLPNGHSLLALSPFIDQHGLLRVGGRLEKGKEFSMEDNDCHPIILPKNHYVTRLLVRKFHHQAVHQGRLLTEGALRSGGFWVVGAKNLVRSEIKSCVTCRKL